MSSSLVIWMLTASTPVPNSLAFIASNSALEQPFGLWLLDDVSGGQNMGQHSIVTPIQDSSGALMVLGVPTESSSPKLTELEGATSILMGPH